MASTKEIINQADLIDRIRSGSKEAEDELIQRYSRGVLLVIKKMVRNYADVEELVQKSLMTALEGIRRGAVRQPDKLSSYVRGVARTLGLVHLRKMQSGRFKDIEEIEPPIDPKHGPFEELLVKEEAEIARQVISELKMERDREIITRYYFHDEDKDSICASMGLTSIEFNQVNSRALARCRHLIKEKLRSKNLGSK